MLSGIWYPPVSKIPASAGNVPDWWASIRPGIRSVRSLGAITATSGYSRSKTCGRLIAATITTQGLPIHPGLAAQHQLGVRGLDQRSEGRRRKQRAFRDGGRHHIGQIGKRPANRISGIMINTVGDHRYGLRVVGSQFRDRTVGGGTDLLRAPLSGRAPPARLETQDWRRSWH